MSDSDEDNDANLPSRDECEKRCQKFATVTGTDTALAMFYLQDRDWDLERALNAFFGGSSQDSTDASSKPVEEETPSQSDVVSDSEPHRFRLLSWNIDGLDDSNLKSRTKGVCDIINRDNPHMVFLQEVIPKSLKLIEKLCPQYQAIPGGRDDYFTAVLLKSGSVEFESSNIVQFFSSLMERNLLGVKCKIKGVPFLVMTSHLESCKEHSRERINQLKKAFSLMAKAGDDRSVIFGGDLNLRDPELDKAGGLPEGVLDLWEITGKRPEAKFTWDLQRNDNLEWNMKFRPRCRFDRLYLRHSKLKPAIKPVYFELVGIERLTSCQRFPSDHWGILTHFDILDRVDK
ncbi:tyrosyl-DNA phosphodiesterase 2-like [Gigantopelta aegis]|uniref:tyrosyl-DNA phosphodiesterase 2-like n=1 Tax=Gigantopelta aegis TaxID=1735272 RepID=UPI001B88D70C|nr:tyrosyl-DNA phosphodiesterase 2-like [Gigantopelta aegis]XP_041361677.1 tyrosyl-DNA phosphodiesterase 2-like [Gigantopelta aegis]